MKEMTINYMTNYMSGRYCMRELVTWVTELIDYLYDYQSEVADYLYLSADYPYEGVNYSVNVISD